MSESCRRGHKGFCFQCGETDCERYESEPPKWVKEIRDDLLIDLKDIQLCERAGDEGTAE